MPTFTHLRIKRVYGKRKLKPEVQQELRNQAIRLRKTGRTYKEIGAIVRAHPTNVCKWWKAYEQGGGQIAIRH